MPARCSGTARDPGRYHEALTLSEELSMRPLAAHCHLGLSKLYRRTDRHGEGGGGSHGLGVNLASARPSTGRILAVGTA